MAENEYHKNDSDDLDDDDDDINGPYDNRYVIGGALSMLISLFLFAYFENQVAELICAIWFLASFFIIFKKEKIKADAAGTDK